MLGSDISEEKCARQQINDDLNIQSSIARREELQSS